MTSGVRLYTSNKPYMLIISVFILVLDDRGS